MTRAPRAAGAARAARRLGLLLVLVLAGCGSGKHAEDGAAAAGDFDPGHARARLLSETAALAPGHTFTLGITLDLEPGWHVYWDGLNDTGYPVKVTPHLPEGFRAGDLQWPAPERLVSPGDILDHVYTGHVTLLLPLEVPADLPAGTQVTLGATVEWLACHEACVPGSGEATLSLPVAEAGTDLRRAMAEEGFPEARTRFEETRRRLPEPLDAASGVRWHWGSGEAGEGTGTPEGTVLFVESDGADHLEFYPARDTAPLAAILQDGASDSGTLALRLGENPERAPAVRGVLDVEQGGAARYFVLDAPIPRP